MYNTQHSFCILFMNEFFTPVLSPLWMSDNWGTWKVSDQAGGMPLTYVSDPPKSVFLPPAQYVIIPNFLSIWVEQWQPCLTKPGRESRLLWWLGGTKVGNQRLSGGPNLKTMAFLLHFGSSVNKHETNTKQSANKNKRKPSTNHFRAP